MTWTEIRRALVLSTTSVLMTAQIAAAQDDPMRERKAELAAARVATPAAEPTAKSTTAAIVPSPTRVFTVTSGPSNTSGHVLVIDDPLSNGNPSAIVTVTQNWNPGGVGGVYNNHTIGVWYTGTHWSIFNQDIAPIPAGASFNVRIGDGFVHEANFSNISGNWSEIDHPMTNNNPSALVTITPNWNPGGGGGVYHDHPIGIWYTGSRWAVYNEDLALMQNGSSFNIVVGSAFVHSASPTSTIGNYTTIDDSRVQANPNAKVFLTNNFNPSVGGGTYVNHVTGVWYTGSTWSVFNQDLALMSDDAAFNVMVYNVPAIASIAVKRDRNLLLTGTSFSNGAVVMVNGVDRTTVNNLTNPTTKLKVKQAIVGIPSGTLVTLQVRNADGLLSDPVTFTRP